MFSRPSRAIRLLAPLNIVGSPGISRTTRLPALASLAILPPISSCRQRVRPSRPPICTRFASRRASSRTSAETRSSKKMMSADCKARMALRVSSSASPGPAPTSVTQPRAGASASLSASARSTPPTPSSGVSVVANARSEKRSQKARRCWPGARRLLTASRKDCASVAQLFRLRGNSASILRRRACARIGAAPSVEIAMTTGERLTMEPNWNWQNSGLSITFAGTPAARAALENARASASSAQSAMASEAPPRSPGDHARRCGVNFAAGWPGARESSVSKVSSKTSA